MKAMRHFNEFEDLQLRNNDQHAYNNDSNKEETIIKNWYDKNFHRDFVYVSEIRV